MKLIRGLENIGTQTLLRKFVLRPFQQIGTAVNDKLSVVGGLVTRHCEFVVAQRIRRACQICILYRQLYTEGTLKNIVKRFAINYGSKLKIAQGRPLGLLMGAAFFSWEKDGVTEEEMKRCAANIENVTKDPEMTDFKFRTHTSCQPEWELVINREHLKVWRKPISNSSLYEYKVYGTFYDIPAWAFFEVQIDTEYRKKWDKLVISLNMVVQDDRTGCEVIHWVMHYPFPMYSREYVYIRRYHVDPISQTMVLVSKSTEHPCCPINGRYVRVSRYSSSMVIKPHEAFDKNGFNYVLTYFDDPQAMIPSPAYSWMATSGVPEFVEQLHQAAIVLHQERSNGRIIRYTVNEQQSDFKQSKSGVISSSSKMPVFA